MGVTLQTRPAGIGVTDLQPVSISRQDHPEMSVSIPHDHVRLLAHQFTEPFRQLVPQDTEIAFSHPTKIGKTPRPKCPLWKNCNHTAFQLKLPKHFTTPPMSLPTTTDLHALHSVLQTITPFTQNDLQLSDPHFALRTIPKGGYFNIMSNICHNLAFVRSGLFRIYHTEALTGEEINAFFFRENEFMVSFKSFITQTPCYYTIQALEDAEVLQIAHADLQRLFQQSHAWERFGRLLAETHFYFLQARTEAFLFKTAEERYLEMMTHQPDLFDRLPLYHISSYLGIKGPSLSRIRKRISAR